MKHKVYILIEDEHNVKTDAVLLEISIIIGWVEF